ncbi:major facilitator superfamily domain-containing protein [Vararia minispora EC-137]|uniref:Major facilitator superfamily domain-containing protein n=1 Tax=Vararia minispora EC-137 TaxID=1314806 RepID=A0ACB8QZS8_9AGAM|nr:major facilitator superfamily domain-containing protein [Vararia minispora EC-137]
MASIIALAAAHTCRPVCRRQIWSSLPARRALHASPVGTSRSAYKKKTKKGAQIESLFGEDDLGESDFFAEEEAKPSASASMSTSPTHPSTDLTSASAKRTEPITTKNVNREHTKATFSELCDFVKHHITHKPSALEPQQIRNSAWYYLFEAATSEDDLRHAAGMFADWVGMGRKFRDEQVHAFVLRCHKLGCPNLAVEVFSNRPYYRFDIPDIIVARELLHSVMKKENLFELSVFISSLYTLYKLPPLINDFISCAMLLAQSLRVDTSTSRELAEVLMPAFRKHVETAPPLVIPRNHILRRQGETRQLSWLRIACGTIDNILSKRGEDQSWLRQWRIASGHMPCRSWKNATGNVRQKGLTELDAQVAAKKFMDKREEFAQIQTGHRFLRLAPRAQVGTQSDVRTNRKTKPKTSKTLPFPFVDTFGSLAVGPMAIGTFLASMDQTIVMASYVSIGNELKELQSTSWVSTAYMLSLASFQPLYGKLSDIFGRKPCLLLAYAIFASGCLACGFARSIPELIAARVLAGVGGGYINIVWATGSAFGGPAGGVLAGSIGWRWSFLLQVPLTIVAFTAVAFMLHVPQPAPAPWSEKARRVDFAGSVCLVCTLTALLTALDRGGNIGWDSISTSLALIICTASAITFVIVETWVAREPVAPVRILTNPTLVSPYVCSLASLGCSVCTVFYVSLYVQAVQGRSATRAGTSLLPSIVASVIGSLVGGNIIQRWGKLRRLTIVMYGVMVCGSMLIFLSAGVIGHSYVGLELGLAMMSVGNGCGLTTTLVSLIAQAGPADQAVATAVSYLFRSLGSVLCLSVGSTVFQSTLRSTLLRTLHRVDVDEIASRVREALSYISQLDPQTRSVVHAAYEHALQMTFAFCVLLSATALLSSLYLKEKPLASE